MGTKSPVILYNKLCVRTDADGQQGVVGSAHNDSRVAAGIPVRYLHRRNIPWLGSRNNLPSRNVEIGISPLTCKYGIDRITDTKPIVENTTIHVRNASTCCF